MTNDEAELRGLRGLIDQTVQRAKAYGPRIAGAVAKQVADFTVSRLAELATVIEARIERMGNTEKR